MIEMYDADRKRKFMFGDFASDVGAALNAGVNPVFIRTLHDETDKTLKTMSERYPEILEKSDYDNLLDAVKSKFKNLDNKNP